jgi:hypothetical protein
MTVSRLRNRSSAALLGAPHGMEPVRRRHGSDFALLRRAGRTLRLAAVCPTPPPTPNAESDPEPRLPRTPIVLQVSEHRFGGEPVSVRVTVDTNDVAQLRFTSTLPAGALVLPAAATVPSGQGFVYLEVPSSRVPDFVAGRIAVEWTNRPFGAVSAGKPVTLMPEPTALQLSFAPDAVPGGQPVTLNLSITPAYPVNLRATLSADSPLLPVPAQVTVPAGSTASVPVATGATATARTVNVTAQFRSVVDIESLQVNTTASGEMPLTVAVSGSGRVTSMPAGIDCGSACAVAFTVGTGVTLAPMPAAGQRFFAWSGDADCSDGVLTMSAARACTAVFLPALPPYPDGLGWVVLGAPLTLASEVDPTPSLARDTNHPVVAYVEALGGDVARLYVKRLEGASFVTLGSGALNAGSITAASEPSLVTTTHGQPFVAWIQGTGIQQNLFVARFNGTAWESVGPPGIPLNYVAGSTASRPALALDAENQPLVAWLENGVVKLKRFDGAAWVAAAGGEGPAGATGDQLRLSTDLDGVPVLAWRQPGGGGALLKVVRGLMFEPLGALINAPGMAMTFFDVKAEVGGATAVLSGAVTPVTVRRQRWDGRAWVFVAGPIVSNDPRPLESLVLTRGFQSEVVLSLANANDNSAVMSAPGLTSPFGTTYSQRLRKLSAVMVRADSPIVAATQSPTSGRYEARVWRFYP